jgi:hypothetical protein
VSSILSTRVFVRSGSGKESEACLTGDGSCVVDIRIGAGWESYSPQEVAGLVQEAWLLSLLH